MDPSYGTELKSKHFRDFEQFNSGSYNRKSAEQQWWVIHWTLMAGEGDPARLLMLMSIGPPWSQLLIQLQLTQVNAP